ncbi:MAG TPA: murein biosynthesis integral membrane protein MurJ, partial [Lautropia sp.]|nr:murein biosynthesis integral membrane protein MurJ [Lautropia sp.]
MNLLRAAATISGLTFVSRVTGLIRETMVAATFGAGPMTDAFFVAFRLPNLLRRLFAEGAFTQAFVPILAETREKDPVRTRSIVDSVATVLFWTLLLVSLAGVLGARYLVYLVASGLGDDGETFEIAVTLTRWMFPYILLISLVALYAGILNLWGRFAVPAFAPVLLNLSFIFSALFLADRFNPPIYALAVGVIVGGVAQLVWQIPALLKIGMLPRIGWAPHRAMADPIVGRILRNMAPAVLGVSVAQFSLIINTQIASYLAPGSVSWISFGDRLMEFPTAMLGIAMGTVLLPSLSQAHAEGNTGQYSALLDWGLRLCLLLAAPAMIGLALLAQPLTALMFHYGAFSDTDLTMTARTVSAYSLGLFGLIAVKILAPGFYAKQDVRTPVKIAISVLVATQLLNLIFVPWLAHAGLALAISLGAWMNSAWLLVGLRRRGLYAPIRGWGAYLGKVACALAAMAALLWFTSRRFDWAALQAQPLERAALVLGLVA